MKILFAAVIATAVMIGFVHRTQNRRLTLAAALLYMGAVLYLVGFLRYRAAAGGVSIKIPMPFWKAVQTGRYGPTTNRSVLNVLLFVPFGYLLPQLLRQWKGRAARWQQIVAAGFCFSLLIETGQLLFRRGVFELDDLVKNTMGAALGYGIWYILEKKATGKNHADR